LIAESLEIGNSRVGDVSLKALNRPLLCCDTHGLVICSRALGANAK